MFKIKIIELPLKKRQKIQKFYQDNSFSNPFLLYFVSLSFALLLFCIPFTFVSLFFPLFSPSFSYPLSFLFFLHPLFSLCYRAGNGQKDVNYLGPRSDRLQSPLLAEVPSILGAEHQRTSRKGFHTRMVQAEAYWSKVIYEILEERLNNSETRKQRLFFLFLSFIYSTDILRAMG